MIGSKRYICCRAIHITLFFGHNEGDEFIRRYVEAIQEQFRTTDIFARIGGDEFGLILPDCSKELACSRLETVRKHLENSVDSYMASFSYGIVEITKTHETTIEELLADADAEMYRHKRMKRGECTLSDQMQAAELKNR